MKNINKYIFLAATIFIASCSEDDKVTVDVQNSVSTGAVLRTIVEDGAFDMFRTTKAINIEIEEQDAEDGNLLDRVELTLSFTDNNPQDGDNTVTSTPFRTLAASDFAPGGDQGLLRSAFTYTLAEVLTVMGLDLIQVLPGDQIVLDLEIFLTDGRSFNADGATGNVSGGSFFSSPFQYTQDIDDGIEFVIEDVNANEISLTNPNFDYVADISIDDTEEGATLQTLNVYRTFVDRSIEEDGINRSEPEALFETFEIADLTLEEGAKIVTLTYTQDELYGDNLTFDDLGVNDEVQLRYELVTTDGRLVTTDENDTEYYIPLIVSECVQLNADAPFPGEYTIKFFDTFGDGWDGANITVQIDGGDVNSFTLEDGEDGTATFTVPEGATTLSVVYNSGNFEEEHSYSILDPNSKSAAADGPFIAVGEITLLVCE